MKLHHIVLAAVLAALLNVVGVLTYGIAQAHTGSPSAVTWGAGMRLTADDLNNTILHLHNTFTAGIVDAHINSAAAISHSKLATPPLVAKAYLSVTAVCAGGAAAGTDCGLGNFEMNGMLATCGGAGAGNCAMETTGANGTYDISLGYTPTNTNFGVVITSGTGDRYCAATALATTKPNFRIICYNNAGTPTDAALTLVVYDQ